MILTCPQCATRYFLPDLQVSRAGRPVKCTHCGNVWRAEPEPDPDAPAAPDPAPPPAPTAPPPSFAMPEPEPEITAAAQRRSEILREKKVEAERHSRQSAVVNAAIWAGLVAVVALTLVLGVVFRIQVVKLWPRTASAYAAIGMPVNSTGLLIDKVVAVPAVIEGRRALVITGVLTNASSSPREAPAFKVSVLDSADKLLTQKTILIKAPPLLVGEARKFSLDLADPPPGYDTVEVTLSLPAAAPAPHPAAPPPPAAHPPAAPAH